ncbi:MAG: hypothetical protein SF066_20780 [Thermoanaerobaculia bacterium]|nr:hypothetical protein [Thermoanaerobaculia bacterium]
MSPRNSSAFLSSLAGCWVAFAVFLGVSAGAQAQTPTSGKFPPNAEIEYERSVIRFPILQCDIGGLCQTCHELYDCGAPDGAITSGSAQSTERKKPRIEMVELTAYMKLVRDVPQRNALGYRQFEFLIEEWELFGYSEMLGGWLSFSASHDVIQPNSLALALQKTSDFPALIVYSAIYDIYLDDVKLVSNRAGTAMGRGVVEIPPRNVTVAFTKPQQVLIGSGDPTEEFCCGTCEDMQTITREEFEAGLAEARAVRMAKKSNSDPAARAALTGGPAPSAAPAAPVKAPGTDGHP